MRNIEIVVIEDNFSFNFLGMRMRVTQVYKTFQVNYQSIRPLLDCNFLKQNILQNFLKHFELFKRSEEIYLFGTSIAFALLAVDSVFV